MSTTAIPTGGSVRKTKERRRAIRYQQPDASLQAERRLETHSITSEVLQRRAPHNIWRHWVRDAWRATVLILSDLAVFAGIRLLVADVRGGLAGESIAELALRLFPNGFLGGWKFSVALVLSMLIAGTYGSGDKRRDAGRVVAGVGFAALLALYPSIWRHDAWKVAFQYLSTVALLGPALLLSRLFVDSVVGRVRSRVGGARAVLVANVDQDWREIAGLVGPSKEFLFVGAVRLGCTFEGEPRAELLRLGEVIEQHKADTVLLWGDLTKDAFSFAVDVALASGCRLLSGPRTPAAAAVEPKAVLLQGTPLTQLTAPSLQAWQLAAKRVLDICGAAVGLVVLGPLLAAIAVWIKRDSPGPFLFVQERLGARGRLFKCFKFRTMRRDAEEILREDRALYQLYIKNDYKLPEEQDPRLTRSGRFLRKTSLDELPQLINVLLGQMSLVGPRPIVPSELEHYGGGAPLFLSLKPGMTGAWAVNGRSKVRYPSRARMELQYIRNWALTSDISILLRTIPVVLRRQGAH
jgi:exopolysaccharide production protein ExoY